MTCKKEPNHEQLTKQFTLLMGRCWHEVTDFNIPPFEYLTCSCDILIDKLRDAIQTGDGSTDCQHNINNSLLLVVEET